MSECQHDVEYDGQSFRCQTCTETWTPSQFVEEYNSLQGDHQAMYALKEKYRLHTLAQYQSLVDITWKEVMPGTRRCCRFCGISEQPDVSHSQTCLIRKLAPGP